MTSRNRDVGSTPRSDTGTPLWNSFRRS